MTYSFRTNGDYIDLVHTDNTSLNVESVLRSLHNSSRAVEWSLSEDQTIISFKFNYIEVNDFPISEIDFDGVAMDSQDDFETGITAMFPSLAVGGSPGSSSYTVYIPTMSQNGTGNLDIVEFENTTGQTITWSRSNIGVYSTIITFASIHIDGFGNWGNGNPFGVISDGGEVIGYYTIYFRGF